MPSNVVPNPLVYRFEDFAGLAVVITVDWNPANRATTGATLHRDADCQFSKILIGLGEDGSPDSTLKSFDLSGFEGDRNFSAGQLGARGFGTIDDFLASQITAGR